MNTINDNKAKIQENVDLEVHNETNQQLINKNNKKCGIIMPISEIDSCPEAHWIEVKRIITESVSRVGFEAELVSNANDVGIIQSRIITNLYENPIVVCDVSCKNPNVMFELGMRLAFDKPTIIIKDNKTNYSFDTSPIEHLEYPRDLRYSSIVEFQKKLADKVLQTFEKSQRDENYSTFLKHFGEYKVTHLEKRNISKEDYIIEELSLIRNILNKQMNFNYDYQNDYLSEYEFSKALSPVSSTKITNSVKFNCIEDAISNIFSTYENYRVDYNFNSDEVIRNIHKFIIKKHKISISLKELRLLLEKYF